MYRYNIKNMYNNTNNKTVGETWADMYTAWNSYVEACRIHTVKCAEYFKQ